MEELGDGTFGRVFLDNDKGEAVKKCFHETTNTIWSGNLREMDILRRCGNHPNIVSLLRVSFDKEENPEHNKLMLHLQPYPTNLDKFISSYEGRFDMSTIRIITVQLLMGLEYLHINRIVHRDIKPANILINPETLEVVLCDFGMAHIRMRYRQGETEVTSPAYRAPEIYKEKKYSYEADIWAVGLILYYMIQGTFAYDYPNIEEKRSTKKINKLKEILLKTEDVEKRKNIREEIQTIKDELRDLVLSRIEKMNIKKSFNARYPFRNLLIGLLQEDANRRLSARQALDLPFFDSVREKYIDNVRKNFPIVSPKMKKISFQDIPERKWISKYTMKYVADNSDIDLENLYPVVFHGLDIFEKYLSYIRSTETLSEQETYLFLHTCFYISHKYYAVTLIPLEVEDFYPEELLSDDMIKKAEEFEEFMISKILDYSIFDMTLYEIVEERINNPDSSEYYKTLKEYLTLSQNTKKYNSYREMYLEHFFKKSVIN